MDKIKEIIENISIDALENSTNIAALAILETNGALVYQTENFDISKEGKVIVNVLNGKKDFRFNNLDFKVTYSTSEGIAASNKDGMGHLIILPFKGGILATYALPQAYPKKVLEFLRGYSNNLGNILI